MKLKKEFKKLFMVLNLQQVAPVLEFSQTTLTH